MWIAACGSKYQLPVCFKWRNLWKCKSWNKSHICAPLPACPCVLLGATCYQWQVLKWCWEYVLPQGRDLVVWNSCGKDENMSHCPFGRRSWGLDSRICFSQLCALDLVSSDGFSTAVAINIASRGHTSTGSVEEGLQLSCFPCKIPIQRGLWH